MIGCFIVIISEWAPNRLLCTLPEISSMPTKQWLQVEVENEVALHKNSYPTSTSSYCLCLLKQILEMSIVVSDWIEISGNNQSNLLL